MMQAATIHATRSVFSLGGMVIPDFAQAVGESAVTPVVGGLNSIVQTGVELLDKYPSLTCSSFVTWAYKQVGIPSTVFSTSSTPQDLYAFLSESKDHTLTQFDKIYL